MRFRRSLNYRRMTFTSRTILMLPLLLLALVSTKSVAVDLDREVTCLTDYAPRENAVVVAVARSERCSDAPELAIYRSIYMGGNRREFGTSIDGPSERGDWNQLATDDLENINSMCMGFTPVPEGYVVTGYSYNPGCGDVGDLRDGYRRVNAASVYKASPGMIVCVGYPLPAGYRTVERIPGYTACNYSVPITSTYGMLTTYTSPGNEYAAIIEKSPVAGVELFMHGDWYQIQSWPNLIQAYQGYGGRFVQLARGEYVIQNLTQISRRDNIIIE